MKVNIQYGIDIEEVPKKISAIVIAALDELEEKIKITRSLAEICEKGVYLDAMAAGLDGLRKQLTDSDAELAGAHGICAGLLEHLAPTRPEAQQPTKPHNVVVPQEEPEELATENTQPVEEEVHEIEQQPDTVEG